MLWYTLPIIVLHQVHLLRFLIVLYYHLLPADKWLAWGYNNLEVTVTYYLPVLDHSPKLLGYFIYLKWIVNLSNAGNGFLNCRQVSCQPLMKLWNIVLFVYIIVYYLIQLLLIQYGRTICVPWSLPIWEWYRPGEVKVKCGVRGTLAQNSSAQLSSAQVSSGQRFPSFVSWQLDTTSTLQYSTVQ